MVTALTKLTNDKALASHMVHWSLKMAKFNLNIEHTAGIENSVAYAALTGRYESG